MREQDVLVIPEPERKGSGLSGKKFVFSSFFIIVGILGYFAIGGSFSIVGNVVGGGGLDPLDKFPISAELSLIKSELSFNQEIERVYIEPKNSNKEILLGKIGAIKLDEIKEPKIVIEGFNGRIKFDGKSINLLKGVASKVIINGVPTAKAEGEISVAIEGLMNYRLLELSDVYLKKYEEEVSGKIVAKEKVSFVLNNENILIEDFFGKIKSGNIGNYGIGKEGLFLEGGIGGLEVDGELKVDLNN